MQEKYCSTRATGKTGDSDKILLDYFMLLIDDSKVSTFIFVLRSMRRSGDRGALRSSTRMKFSVFCSLILAQYSASLLLEFPTAQKHDRRTFPMSRAVSNSRYSTTHSRASGKGSSLCLSALGSGYAAGSRDGLSASLEQRRRRSHRRLSRSLCSLTASVSGDKDRPASDVRTVDGNRNRYSILRRALGGLRGGGAAKSSGKRSASALSAVGGGSLTDQEVAASSAAGEARVGKQPTKGLLGFLLGVSEHDTQIRALALPALLSLLVDPVLSLVDTAYVGRGLGAISLAALGPCTSIFHFSFNTFRSLTQSTTALVSTSLAAGNKEKAGQIVQQMYLLATVLGMLLMGSLLTQSASVLALMGAGPKTALFPEASAYLTTRALAAPAVLMIMVSEGVFRGHADTTAPALAAVSAACANIVLDPLFMFLLGWGMAGAAGATALAQYFAVGIYGSMLWRGTRAGTMTVPFFRRKKVGNADDDGVAAGDGSGAVKPLPLLMTVISANAAMLLRTTALMACWAVATAVATRMSSAAVGAHQVALSLWLLFALVAEAPSIAAQVLGARYIGQGKLEQARSMARRVTTLTLACSGVLAIVLLCFSRVIPRCFTSEPAVLQRLGVLLPLLAVQQPLVAMTLVTEGLLVGAGQFRWLGATTTITSAIAAWFLVELGRRAPAWDVVGIWGCITVMFIGRFSTAAFRVMDRKSGPYWVVRTAKQTEAAGGAAAAVSPRTPAAAADGG